jgi:hypothetical protein
MLSARIELRGEELFCADTGEGGTSTVRPLTPEVLARLRGWAERYDAAVRSGALPPLVEIGREIAAFLDEGDRWLDRVLAGTGEIDFEIAVPGRPEERERILLDVPWELLAPNRFFLAADEERLFRIARRLGGSGEPAALRYRDLALLFMAAEVDGKGVLNYGQEEAAILRATKGLELNLSVEESGAVEFLAQRIAQDGPFEALHLSCHGNIEKGEPFLSLESPEGRESRVKIAELSEALGEEDKKPALVFLSACRTGEHGTAASSLIQSLVRSGVYNAIGWDGSVFDDDAIAFAEIFYKELVAGRSVAYAAARARGALLRRHLTKPSRGRHWHLARVYVGPRGGGPLCATGTPRRAFHGEADYRGFLDIKQKRVPVASAAEFVGWRRQAQRVLRAFGDQEGAGVLIHGVDNQERSSLAARIASRMRGHDRIVIFERYDALRVFEALKNELPPRLQDEFDKTWRNRVANDPSALRTALVDMPQGPFRTADRATRAMPVLLIVNDVERILETPQADEIKTPVKTAYNVVLAAIITAFRDAETESRLLLTSRYDFALTDGRGDDLASRLVPVQLPSLGETEHDQQTSTLELSVKQAGSEQGSAADRETVDRDAEGPSAKPMPRRVFISYSHDSQAHERRVRELSRRLRGDGFDSVIDQDELLPPRSWSLWCEAEICKADFVLMVCTEIYARRINAEVEADLWDGVLWEGRLIKQHLYSAGSADSKFVPLLFADGALAEVPLAAAGRAIYQIEASGGYEALCRLLTNQPLVPLPPLGAPKELPPWYPTRPEPGRDYLIQLKKDLTEMKQLQELMPANVYEESTRAMTLYVLKKMGYIS